MYIYSTLPPGVNKNPSLYFRDGVRTIDFILVWESGKDSCSRIDGVKRGIFEKGLRHEGLQIEREPPEGGLNFIKVNNNFFIYLNINFLNYYYYYNV